MRTMRGAARKMAFDLEDDGGCAEPEVLVRRPLGAEAVGNAEAAAAEAGDWNGTESIGRVDSGGVTGGSSEGILISVRRR